ncbi:hypothetical protein ACHAPJ_006700 [Fusarium lateritium]
MKFSFAILSLVAAAIAVPIEHVSNDAHLVERGSNGSPQANNPSLVERDTKKAKYLLVHSAKE